MPRFQKKPEIVEAIQYKRESAEEAIALVDWVVRHGGISVLSTFGDGPDTTRLRVKVNDDELQPGDWVVYSYDGRYVTVMDDREFEARWEPAEGKSGTADI